MTQLRELRIPRMGSVENAKLICWRIPQGTRFSAGEAIYEVETDKTVTEVQAESDGILALRVAEEGAELKVGDLVGWSAGTDLSPEEIATAVAAQSGSGEQGSGPASPRISPHARRLAQEHGIDLTTIRGSGPQGRITGDDVLRAAQTRPNSASAIPRASETDAAVVPGADVPVVPGYEQVPADAIVNSTRRRTIARRLAESARAAPHLTADVQVDLSVLFQVRERENARLKEAGRPTLSVLSYVAYRAAGLLLKHRELNASYTDSHTLLWKVVNLGIAVDSPGGLAVPVIPDATGLTLHDLNAAIAELAERARSGGLRNSELEGGTFTISNPGSLGPVLRAEAILNPPQAALLGLAAIHRAPVAVEAAGDYRLEVRPLLNLSLTFDHRALDGGHVVRFLADLKGSLESL